MSADATATAKNIHASEWLFRLGFASYLVEAVCDIALTLIFYLLLRPVHKDLALRAAFFGLVSTALFGVAELFYFAALLILGVADYLETFSPDQLNTLALLSLKLYGYGGGIFMVFYGVASILRGYLIFRSGYLPKFLGFLLALAGLGFVTRNRRGVLCLTIGVSTLHTKQHYILNIVAGILLACVAFIVFFRNYPRQEIPALDRRLAPVVALGTIGFVGHSG